MSKRMSNGLRELATFVDEGAAEVEDFQWQVDTRSGSGHELVIRLRVSDKVSPPMIVSIPHYEM